MVTLALTDREAETLREALEMYLSELRMEIADTYQPDFRAALKERHAILSAVIERIEAEMAPSGDDRRPGSHL